MNTPGPKSRYCAYVLRCWHESTAGAGAWRFSLEDVHTSARYGFASIAMLTAFLHEQFFGVSDNGERTAAVDEME